MRGQYGFNLLELMVTMAVIGVVVAMGAPSMVDFIKDMRLTAATNDVLGFFQYARSEATKRSSQVKLCISSDLAACSTSGTNWGVGALAFVDSNNNHQVDAGETVLRVLDPMTPNGITVVATTAFASGYYFFYRPSGAANSVGTLRVCSTGRKARDISVNTIGRPISQPTTVTC